MPKLIPLILSLSAALTWLSGAPAGASPLSPPGLTPAPLHGAAAYVPGQVIVKFRAGADASQRGDALRSRQARVLRSMAHSSVRLVRIPEGSDVQSAAASLERDPAVAWAQPNTIQQAGALPNDPLFGAQWNLSNTGQPVEGVPGAAGADIRAPEAWDRTTGSRDVTVAVVDSGITFTHPDLAPNIWTNPGETGGGREHNGIDDDGNGFVDDAHGWDFVGDDADPTDNEGHGTHVAGIIGARGNNGVGVAGVNWNVSIMPVRVLNNLRTGNCYDIADGLAYATASGARVVNMSIWSGSACQPEEDAIAAAPDTLFVVIAGNDGESADANPKYPCDFPEANIICVAATGPTDQLADYSNYGAENVDIAAPGTSIESTYPKWGPTDVRWSDGFEGSLVGNWAVGIGSDWARTTANPRTGSWSLGDSPIGNYSNNEFNYIDLLQGLDLRGKSDCAVRSYVKGSLGPGDDLIGETSQDGTTLAGGNVADVGTSYAKTLFDLGPLDGRVNGRFLLALSSDASGTADGVNIDDVDVLCVPPLTNYTGASDEFTLDDGTSMAAPHVAGVAALVLSLDPSMPVAQLKARILGSADPVPGLAGLVATGGRLDAARAVDLPRPASGGGTTGSGSSSGAGRGRIASALAGNVSALRKLLARLRRGKLLRSGGFSVALDAPSAGRFTVTLSAKAGRGRTAGSSRMATIAGGSRSTGRAGRTTLKVKLTREGRRILRVGARTRATVTLRFTPKSGADLRGSARVVLR